MTVEQIEWCVTISGNCQQCKFRENCELKDLDIDLEDGYVIC